MSDDMPYEGHVSHMLHDDYHFDYYWTTLD